MEPDASASPPGPTGHSGDAMPATGKPSPSQPAHADDLLEDDQSEAALRESERLFRTTFERAPVGIAHLALDGRCLRCNQQLCDLLGYSHEEVAARTFQDLTNPDELDIDLASIRCLLAGEIDEYATDKRYVRKDGASVWAHLTVSLVRAPSGAPDCFIATLQDITERKRLELEHASLLEQERTAHAQLGAMQTLTDTALSHLALDDLLRELLGRVTAVMGVDHVVTLLLDEDGRTLSAWGAHGLLEEFVGEPKISLGQGFTGHIAASRAPLIVDDLSTLEGVHPLVRDQVRSAVGVPLLVQDLVEDPLVGHRVSRLLGVLAVGSATPRHFTEADVQLLQRAADRIALAIDRAGLFAAEQDAQRRAEVALARAIMSEAQVYERAGRLHAILETMADAVIVYDAEGQPLQSNRAYYEMHALEHAPAGYKFLSMRERAHLMNLRDAITGAPLPFEATPTGRALRGEVVTAPGADTRVRAFDGRELELNVSAAPLREPDGRIAGAVLVLRDMTERNRLEREREAAHEASRRLEEFLATAAHDLRVPLAAVVGYLELAQRKAEQLTAAVREAYPELAPRVEAVRDRVEGAVQGAERLTRLLTVLFDTAAVSADRLELRRAPCDLAALVRAQVEAQRVAASGRAVHLHMPAGGEQVSVEVDADRIGQVVANYLSNALKYSPPDRPVDVSVNVSAEGSMTSEGEWARVAVRDQGLGIPEAERERVWDLFHRVPGVTAQGGVQDGTQSGSLGLGLHICKAIVEAHGGQVGVKSAVGQGSTFWFTLPLASPRSDEAPAAP